MQDQTQRPMVTGVPGRRTILRRPRGNVWIKERRLQLELNDGVHRTSNEAAHTRGQRRLLCGAVYHYPPSEEQDNTRLANEEFKPIIEFLRVANVP